MEPMMASQDGDEVAERYHEIIADLVNELLDTYYGKHPSSNAFGADYEGPQGVPDGTYYIGRENGADGAEDDIGFDYCYRNFRDMETRQREKEYIFGNYGWMDLNGLSDEAPLLRQVFEKGVERGFLDEDALDRFDAATGALEGGIREVREEYDLSDIADLIRDHKIETLRSLLGHGDEESRTIWQLLFSKDEDGDHIENPVTVEAISEANQLMFVRTERYYYESYENEGKWYAYGAVIGYDDTPERFFVHRLPSDPDLRGETDAEWDIDLVKEKMGFDDNLHEVGDDMPYDRRVRVQGDLTFVRRDYDDALSENAESEYGTIRDLHGRKQMDAFLDEHPEFEESDSIYVNTRHVSIRVHPDDTDELKEIQDEFDIEEETVRDEQDRRGYSRLTSKRREEIVTDLLEDRAYRWCAESVGVSEADMRAEAEGTARERFEDVQGQVNSIVGNHTLMVSNARQHPNRRFGHEDTREAVIVPDEATLFLIHDEHEDKQLTLGRGVYEIRFLQGYEDQWWMSN